MDIKELIENEKAIIETESQDKQVAVADNITISALEDTKKNIVEKALPIINDERIVKKHAKKLAENADEGIKVELETQELEIKKKHATNRVTRKEISNKLYILRQEAKRIKKEQAHLNAQQKEEHRMKNEELYWRNHGDTLTEYKMRKGSNRLFCDILLWLDGIKGFLTGLGKVSTALIGALKWILIISAVLIVMLIIPVTREWLLDLLGFINKT